MSTDDGLQGTDNVLAIGDNPLTDIIGAQELGIDSLLITGGILAARKDAYDLDAIGATYVLTRFRLT